MAISSAGTYLAYSRSKISASNFTGTYTILADIKSFPETGSAPERIETTTLSNKQKRTYIDGLQDTAELSFTANYDKAKYLELQAFGNDDNYDIVLVLSDGSVFHWIGTPSVYLNGGEVNSVMEMTINVSAESEITLVSGVKGTLSGNTIQVAVSE